MFIQGATKFAIITKELALLQHNYAAAKRLPAERGAAQAGSSVVLPIAALGPPQDQDPARSSLASAGAEGEILGWL